MEVKMGLENDVKKEEIEIKETVINKPGDSYWTSLWTNSPKPYPPAMGRLPKEDLKDKGYSK